MEPVLLSALRPETAARPRRFRRLTARLLLILVMAGTAAPLKAADPPAVARLLATIETGDWNAALTQATALRPELATYVEWRRLRSREQFPFSTYRSFIERHRNWPDIAGLQERAEDAIDERVPIDERLTFFDAFPPRSRPGRVRYAEALGAVGRLEQARTVLRQSWRRDDYSASEERFVLDNFGSWLRAEDHAARLEQLLWSGDAAAARRIMPMVDARRRAAANLRLQIQAGGKIAARAMRALPADLAQDPGVLFERIRWHRRKDQNAQAQALLLSVRDESQRPDAWWEERGQQVREALALRDYRLAYRLASGHKLSNGLPFAEAEWVAGWVALRFLTQPREALQHFERLYPKVETPISRARAAYWAGRAAVALGRADSANGWYGLAGRYPATFYGQLAAYEIGKRPSFDPKPMPVSQEARAAFAGDARVGLAHLLCRAGGSREAELFIRRLAADFERDRERLTQTIALATGCGRPDLAVGLGRGPVRDSRLDIAGAFPIPALSTLIDASGEQPEPALLLSLARQESGFDVLAQSPAGALGLMQLMPGTARAMAGELGLGYSRVALTGDPDYNVRLGAGYLQRQLDRFGEPALALAAYNAGPSRVESWLAQNGDPRGDMHALIDWIEAIPFRETRNYVQRVLEGAEVYRALLGREQSGAVPLVSRNPGAGPLIDQRFPGEEPS